MRRSGSLGRFGGSVVVAVDFGASSIRVCRVDLDRLDQIDVVHRYAHGPVADSGGTLRWDWDRLVTEMVRGLDLALAAGPVASIGIDTWGVDYGLLDARGQLLAPPVSYRDSRTDAYRCVVDRIGARHLYEIAGLQVLPFNTIFQLATESPRVLARARHVVMLPELLVYTLTGVVAAETTSAGTTGLLDLATGDWSDELIERIGFDRALFPDLLPATTRVGAWKGAPVHLVGGHDTASAVVAGARRGDAFVSAGTWLLVGTESDRHDTSVESEKHDFANEQGALGGIRRLRNVAGWWVLEEMRRVWIDPPPLVALLDQAAGVTEPVPIVDLRHDRFLAPTDMVAEYCAAAGLRSTAARPVVARSVVESMAQSVADTVDQLGPPGEVRMFGGGSQSVLFAERLAARSGRRVRCGPVEATALGNAVTQGVALGRFASLADARLALETMEARS